MIIGGMHTYTHGDGLLLHAAVIFFHGCSRLSVNESLFYLYALLLLTGQSTFLLVFHIVVLKGVQGFCESLLFHDPYNTLSLLLSF